MTLHHQIAALETRVRMLKGERLSFDEESRALYDAVAPTHPESHFKAILDQLDRRFPGGGPLVDRYDAWRRAFVIPRERLDTVFKAAIDACRARTLAHVQPPADDTHRRVTSRFVRNVLDGEVLVRGQLHMCERPGAAGVDRRLEDGIQPFARNDERAAPGIVPIDQRSAARKPTVELIEDRLEVGFRMRWRDRVVERARLLVE